MPASNLRCFRGSVILVSIVGFTFAIILALVLSNKNGQRAAAEEALQTQATTVIKMFRYFIFATASPLRLLAAVISSTNASSAVRLAQVASSPQFPGFLEHAAVKRVQIISEHDRAAWEADQSLQLNTTVEIVDSSGAAISNRSQYYVETDSLSANWTKFRDWSETPIQTCIDSLASLASENATTMIEGVDEKNDLVVIHCSRLVVTNTGASTTDYLVSTHKIATILQGFAKSSEGTPAEIYLQISSVSLPAAITAVSDPGLTASASNNDERVTRIMSMTPTVQWQVVILPSETLLQFTSNNLSSTVIGILVGAVVQLLAVALYFVRNEAKRQRYKLALAEFRAADASMSKTLNAVCHELRNPLHGLQGTLALFLQDHAAQLLPDMKSELSSMWHDIERLEFVLTDVLRMRTMDVVNILPRFGQTDVLAVVRDIANLLRYDVPLHAKLLLVLDKSLNSDSKLPVISDSRLLGQILRITVEHASSRCEPGHIVLHVDHFQCEVEAETTRWLLFEVLFQRKQEVLRKGKNASQMTLPAVTPVPAEVLAGMAPVGLRKQLQNDDTPFSHQHDVVELSRLEAKSDSQRSSIHEMHMDRTISQGGADISVAAAVIAKLGGFSGIHSDVTPLEVSKLMEPKRPASNGRQRSRRFSSSLGRVSVDETPVYDDHISVWERCWFAIPCAPKGSLKQYEHEDDTFSAGGETVTIAPAIQVARSVQMNSGPNTCPENAFAAIPVAQLPPLPVGGSSLSSSTDTGVAVKDTTSDGLGTAPDPSIAPQGSLKAVKLPPLYVSPKPASVLETVPVNPEPVRDVVIVVDDERTNLRVASKFLSAVGVDSVQYLDGAELPTEFKPNVIGIFLDIVMKRSDGVQVCKALRQAGITIPVLAMTSNVTGDNIAAFKAAEFDGILGKPFKLADVRAAVKYCQDYRVVTKPKARRDPAVLSEKTQQESIRRAISSMYSDSSVSEGLRSSAYSVHPKSTASKAATGSTGQDSNLELHSISDASDESDCERDRVRPISQAASSRRGNSQRASRPWFSNLY